MSPYPGFELEFEDCFEQERLDPSRWVAAYLPQWTTGEAARARYRSGGGRLRLRIEPGQPPWSPELEGGLRVSSVQTGLFAGPVGSTVGQHGRGSGARVREPQRNVRLYTPHYGVVEMRARACDDPRAMVALWMIGYEDEPRRSAEICVCEIFGRDVRAGSARIGMGVHPFGDPEISDDFAQVEVAIDVREPHVYAAEWTPGRVRFLLDGQVVRTVAQAPRYPMQLMLGLYEFPEPGAPARERALEFEVEYVRGYRRLPPGG